MVISAWAKHNYVDHSLTDLTSILSFVEQNWHLPTIAGSFDAIADGLNSFFSFGSMNSTPPLYLDPTTGEPVG